MPPMAVVTVCGLILHNLALCSTSHSSLWGVMLRNHGPEGQEDLLSLRATVLGPQGSFGVVTCAAICLGEAASYWRGRPTLVNNFKGCHDTP